MANKIRSVWPFIAGLAVIVGGVISWQQGSWLPIAVAFVGQYVLALCLAIIFGQKAERIAAVVLLMPLAVIGAMGVAIGLLVPEWAQPYAVGVFLYACGFLGYQSTGQPMLKSLAWPIFFVPDVVSKVYYWWIEHSEKDNG